MTELALADLDVPEIDTSRPHAARMYDYYIGGKNHFAADRLVAEAALACWPAGRTGLRENRRFLGRTVRYLAAEAGIRQFLDIGSGLPTTANVHEIAQAADPACRVVYVDNDPMVLAHSRALLSSAPEGGTAYVQADLRFPSEILRSPQVQSVLDFGQPVALLLIAVLHFLEDWDDPAAVLSVLLDALPSGSYLAASHMTLEHDPEGVGGGQRAYREAGLPMRVRDADEFASLAFRGLGLVPPGVVLVSEWRPDSKVPRPAAAEVSCYGGVARKPLWRTCPARAGPLAALFGESRQLIIQHIMFGPDWEAACPSCTNSVDELSQGLLDHLRARDSAAGRDRAQPHGNPSSRVTRPACGPPRCP